MQLRFKLLLIGSHSTTKYFGLSTTIQTFENIKYINKHIFQGKISLLFQAKILILMKFQDFGKNILEYLNDIENIEELDLRNCGLNIQDKIKIDAKLLMNSEKQETEKNNNLAEVK